MTLRLLEDGDARLYEVWCESDILAGPVRGLEQSGRLLENKELRQTEDHYTRCVQDAIRQAQQLQNCCGDRVLEHGGKRLNEYQKNCILKTCGLSIDSYMSGGNIYVAFAVAICCGNAGETEEVCNPYYTFDITNGYARIWADATCYDTGLPDNSLPCGVIYKYGNTVGPSWPQVPPGPPVQGTDYLFRVYLWDNYTCPDILANPRTPFVFAQQWFTAGG